MVISETDYFAKPPQKIISLVPSQTELLSCFNLDKQVIGITKFCIHPKEWFKSKIKIGGTKNANIDLIKKLNPDLIIANKEENVQEQIELLAEEFNVWVTDVNNFNDAMLMINDVGMLTHKMKVALTLIELIKASFSKLQTTNYKLKTCYLIWQRPYMTIGGDTFISDMMNYCGLQNIFSYKKRYPQISLEELANFDCELILLSSEPFPFKQKHVDELKKYLPNKKIILVDGEMFSWYGNRLLQAPKYFKNLLKSLGE